MAQFALAQGAELLQVHPLEMAGRARSMLADEHPDTIELGFAFAEVVRLREQIGDSLQVHLDVATRAGFRRVVGVVPSEAADARLADVVSPLVIEADGTVVPLSYGYPRHLALGNIRRARLHELGKEWLQDGYQRLYDVLARLDSDGAWPQELPVMNIYEAALDIAART